MEETMNDEVIKRKRKKGKRWKWLLLLITFRSSLHSLASSLTVSHAPHSRVAQNALKQTKNRPHRAADRCLRAAQERGPARDCDRRILRPAGRGRRA